MIKKECLVYIFAGEDLFSKDIKLKRLKEAFLPENTAAFNLDVLYAKELGLIELQEKILSLPVNSGKRMIVLKDCQNLKDNLKEFILEYAKKPYPSIILVLDIIPKERKDEFVNNLSKYAELHWFKNPFHLDTFALNRQIEIKRADSALRILAQLFNDGQRPERIMGGLRYAWEKNPVSPTELRKRLRALLNCDIDIKTGRLRPEFALENLIVKLCGFTNSLR